MWSYKITKPRRCTFWIVRQSFETIHRKLVKQNLERTADLLRSKLYEITAFQRMHQKQGSVNRTIWPDYYLKWDRGPGVYFSPCLCLILCLTLISNANTESSYDKIGWVRNLVPWQSRIFCTRPSRCWCYMRPPKQVGYMRAYVLQTLVSAVPREVSANCPESVPCSYNMYIWIRWGRSQPLPSRSQITLNCFFHRFSERDR